MNVVYLTTDDPIYLPSLFEHVLDARRDTTAVFVVPPLYKGQTTAAAVKRYLQTFGAAAAVGLARRALGAKLRRRSIERVCEERGITCATVADVNDPAFLERLRSLGTDLVVSVSCPQLFRRPLIDLAPLGCLNVHGSILPEYRGVMPSFWMLANGEREAGVSIFYVDDEIDGGELCGQRVFAIEDGESLDAFVRRSKAVAADLLLEVLDAIEEGETTRRPLDLAAGSYYSWPDRAAVERFRATGRRVW